MSHTMIATATIFRGRYVVCGIHALIKETILITEIECFEHGVQAEAEETAEHWSLYNVLDVQMFLQYSNETDI